MKKTGLYIVMILSIIGTGILPCQADVSISQLENVFDDFLLGGDIQMIYRVDSKPYFGAKIGDTDDSNSHYSELLGKLRLTAGKETGWGKMEAQFAPAFVSTIGQDFYGVANNAEDVKIDQAWLKFGRIANGPLSLTVGSQNIKIEKQFLVGDGQGQEAALWIQGIDSFPFAIVADGDFGLFKPTLYYAQSKNYSQTWEGKDDVDVFGINFHVDIKDDTFVYGGFVQKIDNSADDGFNEQDTGAIYGGFDLAMGGFQVEGEAAWQFGDVSFLSGEKKDRKALAWNLRAKYTLPVRHSPYLRLHYVFYEGDDLNDDDIQEFDPMFGGFADWNYTIIGEITGEAQLPAINRKSSIFEIGAAPTETTLLQAMYIVHKLDKPYAAMGSLNPVPVSSRNWADEVNLVFTWSASDNLLVFLLGGLATPGDAAKEFYGSNDTAVFGQTWLMYTF